MSVWSMIFQDLLHSHGTSCNRVEQLRNKNTHSVVMSLNLAGECVWWLDFSLNLILSTFVRAELWLYEKSSKAKFFLCPKDTFSAAPLAAVWPPYSSLPAPTSSLQYSLQSSWAGRQVRHHTTRGLLTPAARLSKPLSMQLAKPWPALIQKKKKLETCNRIIF